MDTLNTEKKLIDSAKLKKMMFCICLFASSKMIYLLINPLIAYIKESYPGIDAATVSTLTTTPKAVVGMITALLIGPLMLKVNRKTIGIIFIIIQIIFVLTFYFVGSTGGSFWLLYIATALIGIVFGGYGPFLNTLIKDHYPAEEAARKISLYLVFLNIGNVAYLTIGGKIAAGNGGADWPKAFLVGLYCIPVLILFWILMPRDYCVPTSQLANAQQPVKETKKFTFKCVGAACLLICVPHFLFYIGQNAYNANLSYHVIKDLAIGTSVQTANATTISRIAIIVISLSYKFWQKLLKKWIVPAGFASMVVALMILKSATSIPMVYLASFLSNVGTGLMFSTAAARIMEVMKPGYASIGASLFVVANNLAATFAVRINTAVGALFAEGAAGRFVSGALFTGIGLVLTIWLYVIDPKIMHPVWKEDEAAA